jgi:hypothetical protein
VDFFSEKKEGPVSFQRQDFLTKLLKMGGENDEREEQKRQFGETKPMESFDEINGIVERNQWNRSTKPMDLFRESVGFS